MHLNQQLEGGTSLSHVVSVLQRSEKAKLDRFFFNQDLCNKQKHLLSLCNNNLIMSY